MTSNQIAYWNLVEQKRANMASENTKRFSAEETQRANQAKEAETFRSNLAKEQETKRSNLAHEYEATRHNRQQERFSQDQLTIEGHKLNETKRHNVASESVGMTGNITGLLGNVAKYLAG